MPLLPNAAARPHKPRILLVPPPELPVPAVQGGAVETLVTHLIRENERRGCLDLLCASIPDPAAAEQAKALRHTRMLYVARPRGARRYWPLVFIERCFGIAAPYDPWYQKVQLSLALELPPPDLIVAEGGNLTQCSAISRMFGRGRCLAHLHGQTACSHTMDDIYGGVLALSEFIRDDYLKTSSLDRQHAYILHNCIDTARFTPGAPDAALRASLGFAPEDFVVLFCGRLEPDKGIHKLLEAMAAVDDARCKLLIVGSPFFGRTQSSPFLRKLEQQAHALGDRVRFTGYVPNENLPDYYRLADLVCVPTLVEEAAGLVAVEAMGCGRPVLATRSGGMPEYLQGSQAILVDRGPELAAQLSWAIRMLHEHPDLCAQMGAAGARAAQRFSTAAFYETFLHIVYDFLGLGPVPEPDAGGAP
ncbi:MAG TPA: glycosyltransferase family 4 protein [Candidatus Gemmiger stercoripullorum]|nr:glycosyltransferase family 4 protein [Candidatus Gemmiger stercoripullorum]